MPKRKTYQQNFIAGVKMFMAVAEASSLKEAAGGLGIPYMTLYKLMDGSNKPTVEQGITLCNVAGYSANWLYLSKGEIYYSDEMESANLMKEIKSLRAAVLNKKHS